MTNYASTPASYGAATAGQDALLLAARILLGAIFVQSGFGKLMALGGFIAGMESQGVPMATIVAPIGALVEAFGGLAIVLGAWTRLAALLVAAFTVAATVIAHRYWDAAPDAMKMQQIQFMKNLAIIGGFLSLVASGGGRFSVDGWLSRR
ncbi:putative oxidoreductase [Azospirillum lipoferum]|uniref:DoxX family protein n=1 Tax=Azospirillum lipoferum TaxID=193 RepID=A0A5A9GMU1_AZOLI|nr:MULTISPECIES: DoxX family protein [Azospirillum]KAA0595768.1 DoxX family protein [Azospirillum lipoferum]MCP1611361.1 putative oxidoreductase [Azospirillum lipoferum]MDW5537164.1 DoxX family protein [Azospirillum sp. NL1]